MKKIIVIGGGVLGASTAYQLAKRGIDVTLIDRNDLGQATDAAAGIICPWLSQRRNKIWYRLAKGGAGYYPGLIEQLAEDGETEIGYSRVGAISVHHDADKLSAMEQRAHKRRVDAPEIGKIAQLNESETKNVFPFLGAGYQSVHISGAARVNGRLLRQALLRGAKKHGALLHDGNAEIIFKASRVNGVRINDEILYADTVIAANGVWMNELLKPLGIQFAVTSQKAQIMHLGVPDFATAGLPVVMPPNDQYLVPFDDNRIAAGATHENDAGLDYRVTAGGVNEILNKALSIFPGLNHTSLMETRIGYRPFTPGSLPVIGHIPGYEGLAVANGLGASGLTMGPFIGDQLAKLTLGEPLDIDTNNYPVSGAIL